MKDHTMHAIQTFPSVSIEALPSGLFRLEDESCIDGIAAIDLHPAQVQVLAAMVGFNMPDKTRQALGRMSRRLHALHKQAQELEGQLLTCVVEQDIHVAPELTAAEFIAYNLGELLQDLEAIQAPDLEPVPDAVNPGGQLTLPV
jgi:hypothetical protein